MTMARMAIECEAVYSNIKEKNKQTKKARGVTSEQRLTQF